MKKTIEAINELSENEEIVFEVVNPEFFKSLYLFISFSMFGHRHLFCVEEPLDTCQPYIMVNRKSIPMDCEWKVSQHDKSHIQGLIDKIGMKVS